MNKTEREMMGRVFAMAIPCSLLIFGLGYLLAA